MRRQPIGSAVYDLPLGNGRKWLNTTGPVDWFLGSWQVAGILTLRSGLPFTPLVSQDISNTGTTNHPNRIGDGTLPSGQRTPDHWFDLGAFTLPAPYTYGNSERNILFGPPMKNADLKLGKNFGLGEEKRLEFRAEVFNLTNTPHFGLPNPNVDLTQQAGKITSISGEPREIQLGLKLVF